MSRRLIFFLVLVAGAGLWTHVLRARQATTQHAANFATLPARFGTRNGVDEDFDPRTRERLRADNVIGRVYQDPADGSILELFVAYFGSQENGSQIHSPQNCLPGGGWHILERAKWSVPTQSGLQQVNEFVISKGEGKQIIHYWFVTRSGIISNEFALKFDLVRNALLGRPTDAAFVRLARPVGPEGLDQARNDLRAFCKSVIPALDRAVPIAPWSSRIAFAF